MKTAKLNIKGWFFSISPPNLLDGGTYAQGCDSPFYILCTEWCLSACFISNTIERISIKFVIEVKIC
jgi:hypothetical protein